MLIGDDYWSGKLLTHVKLSELIWLQSYGRALSIHLILGIFQCLGITNVTQEHIRIISFNEGVW